MAQAIPFLQLFIIVQCVLFLLFLFINKRLTLVANRLLAWLVGMLALHMVVNLFNQHLFAGVLPNFGVAFGLCYGPILYFYSKALAFRQFTLSSKMFWHGVPAIVALLLASFTSLPTLLFAAGIFMSLTVYYLAILHSLKRYRQVLSQTRTEYEQIALNWLSNLLGLQLVLILLNIASVSLYYSGQTVLAQITEIALFTGLWMLVSVIIFQGLQHPDIFAGVTEEEAQLVPEEKDSSALPDELLAELMVQIDAHMTKSAPFLTPGLTVKLLAKQLSFTPRYVSQAINSQTGKNFSEYVNSYKIKHACQLLSSIDNQELNVMDVMLQSGFNTKSNFNRAFKSETGLTPYEYKQNILKE